MELRSYMEHEAYDRIELDGWCRATGVVLVFYFWNVDNVVYDNLHAFTVSPLRFSGFCRLRDGNNNMMQTEAKVPGPQRMTARPFRRRSASYRPEVLHPLVPLLETKKEHRPRIRTSTPVPLTSCTHQATRRIFGNWLRLSYSCYIATLFVLLGKQANLFVCTEIFFFEQSTEIFLMHDEMKCNIAVQAQHAGPAKRWCHSPSIRLPYHLLMTPWFSVFVFSKDCFVTVFINNRSEKRLCCLEF